MSKIYIGDRVSVDGIPINDPNYCYNGYDGKVIAIEPDCFTGNVILVWFTELGRSARIARSKCTRIVPEKQSLFRARRENGSVQKSYSAPRHYGWWEESQEPCN